MSSEKKYLSFLMSAGFNGCSSPRQPAAPSQLPAAASQLAPGGTGSGGGGGSGEAAGGGGAVSAPTSTDKPTCPVVSGACPCVC